MFDCGEGTQRQLVSTHSVSAMSIDHVFITHMHGDHVFGLPSLLTTRLFPYLSGTSSSVPLASFFMRIFCILHYVECFSGPSLVWWPPQAVIYASRNVTSAVFGVAFVWADSYSLCTTRS